MFCIILRITYYGAGTAAGWGNQRGFPVLGLSKSKIYNMVCFILAFRNKV
jgi:hypothetical protein